MAARSVSASGSLSRRYRIYSRDVGAPLSAGRLDGSVMTGHLLGPPSSYPTPPRMIRGAPAASPDWRSGSANDTVRPVSVAMGDAALWAGVAASVLMSSAALAVSLATARRSRRPVGTTPTVAHPAPAIEQPRPPAPSPQPPRDPIVAWRIQHVRGDRWALTNIGADTATGVAIDLRRSPPVGVLNLGDGTVHPGHSVAIVIAPGSGRRELWVSWQGRPDAVPVPLPFPTPR
jgi:hypothetical protein